MHTFRGLGALRRRFLTFLYLQTVNMTRTHKTKVRILPRRLAVGLSCSAILRLG